MAGDHFGDGLSVGAMELHQRGAQDMRQERASDLAAGLSEPAGVSASAAGNGQADPAAEGRRIRFWRDVLRRRLLAIADLLAAAAAMTVLVSSPTYLPWVLALLPLWVVLAKVIGLYDHDHRALRHQTLDELGAIAVWAASGAAGSALLLGLLPAGEPGATALAGAWLAGVISAAAFRATARWLWRRITPPARTVVLGDGELADSIRRKLTLFGDMHLRLIDGPEPATATPSEDLPPGVDRVIVATSEVDPDLIARLTRTCRLREVKLSVVSPLRGRSRPLSPLTQVADLPVLEFETWDVSRSTMLLKRGFDLVVALPALVLTLPLLPLIAAAIKVESRGPLFFGQRRAGLDGEPFRMLKFRTMVADAEQRLAEIVRLEELREPVFKVDGDPRITRVGRFLRRFSLDELPQLINVVRGEMSIVGPRPEQVELVERYRPEHRFRLVVKPGITGPMQVFGRGELSFPERLAVELDYVENVSLARDLRILAETVPAMVRGTGAF